MHVIRENDDLFTVGYYRSTDSMWIPVQDFANFDDAAGTCSWLNGGLDPELTGRLIEALKIGGKLGPITGKVEWP